MNALEAMCKRSQTDGDAKNGELQKKVERMLGKGPMRFGPPRQPMEFTSQFHRMNQRQVLAYVSTKASWETVAKDNKKYFTDTEILRIVKFCNNEEDKALEMLRKTDPRYLRVSARDIEQQLSSKTLFPVPELKTKEGEDVFYMRPARFFPKKTKTKSVICNLTYVMDTIYQRNYSYKNGIAFVANMNDWTMENFCVDYCLKFMQGLQGQLGPVKVNLFLIVNPPSWFNKVWKIMKPMLSSKFRKKVHMIPEKDLGNFLAQGYAKLLPDEFVDGKCDTTELVQDFITYRLTLEKLYGTEMQDEGQITFGSLNRAAKASKKKEKATVDPVEYSYTEDMGESSMWIMEGSSTLEPKSQRLSNSSRQRRPLM